MLSLPPQSLNPLRVCLGPLVFANLKTRFINCEGPRDDHAA